MQAVSYYLYVKLNTMLFSFFSTNGHLFPIQFHTRKLRNEIKFKKFKKFNYINAFKKFCNHFHYICLYYRHTHYGISQRQHVSRVYLIHSNCARLHNFFFFMMGHGENGYLHSKMEQKWLKINNRGVWNKDVLGGKKSKN